MAKKVKLFALSTCPSCRRTKQFLQDNNIAHELVEVDMLPGGEQWVVAKEVKGYNPEATYPTLVVMDVIVGYDEKAMKKALELPS